MKIGITGSSGRIGRHLVQTLRMNHEVITFGREDSDIEWAMGVMPSQLQLNEIDVLIHLAWSLKDRRNDFHLNVGGTGSISFAAKRSGVPFLFISSVAASSKSHYGLAKAEAEKLVMENSGQIVRVGLVPNASRYSNFSTRLIGFYPNLPVTIRITPYKTFEDFILEWIGNEEFHLEPQKCISLSTQKLSPKRVFSGKSRVMLPIPYTLIRLIIYLTKNFSLRVRNLDDALDSLITITSETK